MDDRPSAGEVCMTFFKNHLNGVLTIVIPVLIFPILLVSTEPKYVCLYIICVMAIFWVIEIIPLYITSLIPVFYFPMVGILNSDVVCQQFFKDALVMFVAGLMIALAIEYSNLHQRVAYAVILIVGCSPKRIHFGLLFVTSLISFWISNSSATAMMCPIVRAILTELQEQKSIKIYKDENDEELSPSKIANAFYLGIAYTSSIGGCGTLIGTGTNVAFKGIYDARFPNANDAPIDFPKFMATMSPIMLIDTILCIYALQITNMGLFRPNSKEGIEIQESGKSTDLIKSVIDQRWAELGRMTAHEIQVLLLFIIMIALLCGLKPADEIGWYKISATQIKTALPIVFICIMLFVFPASYNFCRWCYGPGPYPKSRMLGCMEWDYLQKNMPWGLVFLLGGGFALAEGSMQSGMAKWIGETLKPLKVLPLPVIQFVIILFAMFLTAFSSNVAIANILVPVVAEIAIAVRIHPLFLVFPAGIACSMAFHLPVSTPPNAIVAGYFNVKTPDMIVGGILPSIIAAVSLLLTGQTWLYVIYPTLGTYPDWAK